MNRSSLTFALTFVALLASATGSASASTITGTDLLNILVESQVITEDDAKALVQEVRSRNAAPDTEANLVGADEILQLLVSSGVVTAESYKALKDKVEKRTAALEKQEQSKSEGTGSAVDDPGVRVPYIPDYVRRELHDSLKFSVEADVVDKVKEEAVRTARIYGWGIKEAPSWVHKVTLSGDVRVRYQGDFFADNGILAQPDVSGVNSSGSATSEDAQTNVIDDRHRLRSRLRLMLKAKPFERVEVGMRLVTGDQGNPVSSNQTLGGFSEKWEANFDLGYIKYKALTNDYTLLGGRFKNPFVHTDLVFDSDMTFEGLGGTYFFNRDDTIYGDDSQWDSFVTLGVFPIQEIHQYRFASAGEIRDSVAETNKEDKYLYALQLGADYNFFNTNQLTMALSYYHYSNVTGKQNGVGSTVQDTTVSDFFQVGNSLQNINGDPGGTTLALASEFEILNATLKYRIANFYPTYIWLHADFVQNLGFDQEQVSLRTGNNVPDRDTGYQLGVSFGTQKVKYLRDWNLSFKYRYLEGDAVLDAFADSDFLYGGTDSEGFILQGQYGVLDNTIASLRLLSADAIDADDDDPLFSIGVDTVQLDITAKF